MSRLKLSNLSKWCVTGNINKLKEYYLNNPTIDIHHNNEEMFGLSCAYGNLNVAEWLFQLSQNKEIGLINIHAENEGVFYVACQNGHLEIAKWLWKLSHDKNIGSINIHNYNEYPFTASCKRGHLEVAKWLWKLSQDENVGIINIHTDDDRVFIESFYSDRVEVLKWLWKLSNITENKKPYDIHASNDFMFRTSCCFEKLYMAKELYLCDRGRIDVSVINNYYNEIKKDKFLLNIIGADYKNNPQLRKEYRHAYYKWKLCIVLKMSYILTKFHDQVLDKSYSPNGTGYVRTMNDFNNKISTLS